MRLSTNFVQSISTTAYQIFIFLSDSIKLGRSCSSDVYGILRTKSEVFIDILWFEVHVNRWSSYQYVPLILPCGLCYNYAHVQTVHTRYYFSPPPSSMPGSEAKYISSLMFSCPCPPVENIWWFELNFLSLTPFSSGM